MRHGQTNWNINKILQGQTNIDLNETGINQAKAKIEEIKNLDINLIFCSPLNRAAQTAKIVSNRKIPIIYNDSLTERCFGDFEGKKKVWNIAMNITIIMQTYRQTMLNQYKICVIEYTLFWTKYPAHTKIRKFY